MEIIFKIVKSIIKLESVSLYQDKNNHLTDKLQELGLIDKKRQFTGRNDIKIIYIHPKNTKKDKNCIDFNSISGWLLTNHKDDDFCTQLALVLLKWAND